MQICGRKDSAFRFSLFLLKRVHLELTAISASTVAQFAGQVPSTAAYQAAIAVYPVVVPPATAAVVEVRAAEEEDEEEDRVEEEREDVLVTATGVMRVGITASSP